MKKNRKITGCNQLDLETLGSRSIDYAQKNSPDTGAKKTYVARKARGHEAGERVGVGMRHQRRREVGLDDRPQLLDEDVDARDTDERVIVGEGRVHHGDHFPEASVVLVRGRPRRRVVHGREPDSREHAEVGPKRPQRIRHRLADLFVSPVAIAGELRQGIRPRTEPVETVDLYENVEVSDAVEHGGRRAVRRNPGAHSVDLPICECQNHLEEFAPVKCKNVKSHPHMI